MHRLSGTIPSQVALDWIRNQVHGHGNKPARSIPSRFLPPGSFLEFLLWLPSAMDRELKVWAESPFLLKLTLVIVFYQSSRKETRTPSERRSIQQILESYGWMCCSGCSFSQSWRTGQRQWQLVEHLKQVLSSWTIGKDGDRRRTHGPVSQLMPNSKVYTGSEKAMMPALDVPVWYLSLTWAELVLSFGYSLLMVLACGLHLFYHPQSSSHQLSGSRPCITCPPRDWICAE